MIRRTFLAQLGATVIPAVMPFQTFWPKKSDQTLGLPLDMEQRFLQYMKERIGFSCIEDFTDEDEEFILQTAVHFFGVGGPCSCCDPTDYDNLERKLLPKDSFMKNYCDWANCEEWPKEWEDDNVAVAGLIEADERLYDEIIRLLKEKT